MRGQSGLQKEPCPLNQRGLSSLWIVTVRGCALGGTYSELVFHCVPKAQHGLGTQNSPIQGPNSKHFSQDPRRHGCLCLLAAGSEALRDSSCQASRGWGGPHHLLSTLWLLSSATGSHLTSNVAETQSHVPSTASVMGPISQRQKEAQSAG